MCLSPISIKTPSRYISLHGGQPITLQVPCNKCAECLESKRSEWHFRCYHQVKDCINHGGFVYFDTLTYDDNHIPKLSDYFDIVKNKISDFTCFNRSHLRDFFKRLRRRLTYHFGNVSFKYFLTSEYGTDPRYTHRPHYHIMFFVYGKNMLPFNFSTFVADSWIYGRTDGIGTSDGKRVYQSVDYVNSHIFTLNKSNLSDILMCCRYISKYVTKDSTFTQILDNRKSLIRNVVSSDFDVDTLFRNIDMFHLQSKGFGLTFLSNLDNFDSMCLYDKNICVIKDSETVISVLPVPMYYKRHLYYKLVKDGDRRVWQFNDLGKERYFDNMLNRLDSIIDRYTKLYDNASAEHKRIIFDILNGRSIIDFAEYVVFYKGRMRPITSHDLDLHFQKFELTQCEVDKYVIMDDQLRSSSVVFDDDYSRFPVDRDRSKILCFNYDYSDDLFNRKFIIYTSEYDFSDFINRFCYTQNSSSHFSRFDDLFDLFSQLRLPINANKQAVYNHKEYLTNLYKNIYG